MTAAAGLAPVAVLGLNYLGLLCLCLAKERHFAALYGAAAPLPAPLRRSLRRHAWLALAFALVLAVLAGGGQGPLLWCGSLTAAALALVLLLPWAPRLVLCLGGVASVSVLLSLAYW